MRGTNGGEGAMSLSGDGQSLTLAGYGLAADQLRTAATPLRLASVSAMGDVMLSTGPSLGAANLGSGSSLTAAGGSLASPWVGTSGGLASINATGTLTQSVPGSVQDLQSLAGQTWVALGASGQRAAGIYALSPAAAGSVSVEAVRAMTNVTAFAMLDLNASIAGADTLYAATTTQTTSTGRLLGYKFTLRSSGLWGTAGSFELPGAASFNGLTARALGGQVQLLGTTPDSLLSLVDPWGYTEVNKGVFGGAHNWTTLATAAPNTTLRGVALAPAAVPEPGAWALALAGAGCCLWLRHRPPRR